MGLFDQIEPTARHRVHVCLGPNCSARGSGALLDLLEREIEAAGLAQEVEVVAVGCRSRCEIGPSINVYPGAFFYTCMDEKRIGELVKHHLQNEAPITSYLVS